MNGMKWSGLGWGGMGWDGMGWDGMGWDGIYCVYGVAIAVMIVCWSTPFLIRH